jgi:hypothetical protein
MFNLEREDEAFASAGAESRSFVSKNQPDGCSLLFVFVCFRVDDAGLEIL